MKPEDKIRLSLIVARARNGVIGHQGKMPWRIASEMAHFKRTTLGKPVLMGRKTWDSLHTRPLPGRDNLVLTRDKTYKAIGAECFTDFETMHARSVALARACGANEVMVIGGAMLYACALPFADRVYLTEIDADFPGDAWFADLDPLQWCLSSISPAQQKNPDEPPYSIKTFNFL